MVNRIIYLNYARDDLKAIFTYIAEDSPIYARLEIKKIKAFAESLKKTPLKGRYFVTLRGQEIRLVVFKNYVIYYFITESQVNILTIHHHARSITNNPAFKETE